MIRPDVFLAIVRRRNIEELLSLVDGYEFPICTEDSFMRIEDCIDDEDGTLDF